MCTVGRFALALFLPSLSCVADTEGLALLTGARPGEDPASSGGLVVTPGRMDFGIVNPNCDPITQDGLLRNVGDLGILIESVELTGDSSNVFRPVFPELPFRLEPGSESPWSVRLAANEGSLGVHEAQLVLFAAISDGRRLRVERSLRVEVDDRPIRVDRFVQSRRRLTDVLFVVDDSASMVAEQNALGRNFTAFLEAANDGLADFHIGVTTTDISPEGERGRLVPLRAPGEPAAARSAHIVTRASLPNPVEAFRQNALVGIDGALVEQGLEAAALALTAPLTARDGDNQGFLREDASLALVFVSDEDDGSARPTAVYADLFRSLVDDDPNRVSASAIVGPEDTGCQGAEGRATAGNRYIEVVRELRGRVESICTTDWGDALARLSGVAFGLRSRFVLTARPESEPEVTVDGAPRPRINAVGEETWSVDGEDGVLTFGRSFTPREGAIIEVTYPVACPLEPRRE